MTFLDIYEVGYAMMTIPEPPAPEVGLRTPGEDLPLPPPPPPVLVVPSEPEVPGDEPPAPPPPGPADPPVEELALR